jgi:hypothetical protein
MKGRPLKLPFLFFLIITFIILFSILEAYSTLITISEVEPLPRRGSIQYNFGKQGSPFRYTEVRSITLTLTGNDVVSVDVQWYRRFRTSWGYNVTISVSLMDDGGNTISSGSIGPFCFIGGGLSIDRVPVNPVNIDDIAAVRASADIGDVCAEPPLPEPLDLDEGLGEEI